MSNEYLDKDYSEEKQLHECIIKIINNTIKDVDNDYNEISVSQRVDEIDGLIECITYSFDRTELNDTYSKMQHKIYNKFYKSIIIKFLEDGSADKLNKNAIRLYFDTTCHKDFFELLTKNIVNLSDKDEEEIRIYNYYKKFFIF